MDFVEEAAVVAALVHRRRKRRRKFWVHPLISERPTKGKYMLLHEKLKQYPNKFHEYYRMSVNSFIYLLSALTVSGMLAKQNTVMRDCIGVEEKLAVTLRYLGTGCSFRFLHFEYLIGRATVAEIVAETCAALWNVLRGKYMKQPTTEDWLRISETFAARADYPHCLGAIDGKHVRIFRPSHSGSDFFNHKKFFSVVLMAVADANYCFTYINVGAYGKESDSNVLKNTVLGKRIYSNTLNVPQPKPLVADTDGAPVPYTFVADEAFALAENIMRPYPGRNLTHERRIFNYRLSRARRFVECAFEILANKWRLFHRPIDVSCDFADSIIKACCVLHNFVRQRNGYNFDDTLTCPLDSIPPRGTRGTSTGMNIRDHLAQYFCSDLGLLPWQNRIVANM